MVMTQPRVLVVDDEASVRRQLQVGLHQRGYDVEGAEDGFSTLKIIKAAEKKLTPFNCVVTDIRLPDINGMKLLQVIKCSYPMMPVVVMSGYGDEHTRSSVVELQGNAYLDKPFETDDLDAALRKIGLPRGEVEAATPDVHQERCLESAYIFIRGKSDTDLYDVYSRLYFADGVLYCDAVRDEGSEREWDIVVLVQGATQSDLEDFVKTRVDTLEGVTSRLIHHSQKPRLGEELESYLQTYERTAAMEQCGGQVQEKREPRSVSAYAIVEIAPSAVVPLYSKFSLTDGIVHCDATDGMKMLLLLLQARDYRQLHSLVTNEIHTQPGVLRVRVLDIIEMLHM